MIDSPIEELSGQKVLKLFDRRYAAEFRNSEAIGDWVPYLEQQYHKLIQDGSIREFVAHLESEDADVLEWGDAEYEAFVHYRMRKLYQTEVAAYRALEDIQGRDVPRVFACVTLPVPALSQEASFREWVDIPGIMMEYIEGLPMTDLATYAPKEKWQFVGDEAIRIVHAVIARGILNEDINRRSFIVNPQKDFAVRMTDFANCRFRHEYRDEEHWRYWQARQDEEGAVGYVMQWKLGEVSRGWFTYHRSKWAKKLDDDFMREDS